MANLEYVDRLRIHHVGPPLGFVVMLLLFTRLRLLAYVFDLMFLVF